MRFFLEQRERQETGNRRKLKSAGRSTHIKRNGDRGCVSVCARVLVCLRKNAKKILHLWQPSYIVSLPAAEDDSWYIKSD